MLSFIAITLFVATMMWACIWQVKIVKSGYKSGDPFYFLVSMPRSSWIRAGSEIRGGVTSFLFP